MVRKRVVVSGTVQGVFYRDTCRRVAEEHGVSGWVRNLADGRVEAVFEGDPDGVETLVRWARLGPPSADVRAVEVRDEEPEGLTGFEVRHSTGGGA
ncbi:acylphosphatase [Streptomyces tirandamycinicus]|uniref:acylphosphatase n=1 Tax=Streptomyces TaxID=1883 RepID=UPI0014816C7E|nr:MULTISPECIES: acylphosphatase [Streptomyces]MCY0983551.1 acylphosphatase [Streptomyces tirandamycinicus]